MRRTYSSPSGEDEDCFVVKLLRGLTKDFLEERPDVRQVDPFPEVAESEPSLPAVSSYALRR